MEDDAEDVKRCECKRVHKDAGVVDVVREGPHFPGKFPCSHTNAMFALIPCASTG